MRVLVGFAVLWIASVVTCSAALGAQTFDGITIIELSDKESGEAIRGHSMGYAPFIVTYVSGQGTYAALGTRDKRLCVAWAQAGSYTGDAITFGLPASEQSQKLVHPSVCQPFTLSFSGADRVRIEAANKYSRSGPVAPSATEIRYAGEHDVIARVPLVAFNWGMPIFSRHDIKGVSLGPVPAVKGRLAANVEFHQGPPRSTAAGTNALLRIVIPRADDPANPMTVSGYIAPAALLGWPWDVLFAAEYQENLGEQVLTEVFEEAVVEHYGQPARNVPGVQGGTMTLQWFFDLAGRPLSVGASAPENCLATREHWIDKVELRAIDDDFGPWGCSLIMLMVHDGKRGTVKRYSVEAVSGYVMALSHFIRRLDEIREMQEKIQAAQAYKPKL